jgi:hypothetical protein
VGSRRPQRRIAVARRYSTCVGWQVYPDGLRVAPRGTKDGKLTLNITTVAAWLMSQTSDFRTTHHDIKSKSVVVERHTAQKQFVLLYPTWSGLLCYTGVAAARGTGFSTPHDTAEWLEKLLEHPYDQPRSPQEIASLIMSEGDTWLPKVVPPKDRRSTFTMIAYDGAIPRLWMISNFKKANRSGWRNAAASAFGPTGRKAPSARR